MAEQEWIVDLPGARLVTSRIIGDLDVTDMGKVTLDRGGEFTFHPLHVIDVVLNEEVVAAYFRNYIKCLIGMVEIEAGDIEDIDRFDQQFEPRRLKLADRKPQIANKMSSLSSPLPAPDGAIPARQLS